MCRALCQVRGELKRSGSRPFCDKHKLPLLPPQPTTPPGDCSSPSRISVLSFYRTVIYQQYSYNPPRTKTVLAKRMRKHEP